MADNGIGDISPTIEMEVEVEPSAEIEMEMEVDMGGTASEYNAEAWAVGERHGVPVSETDQTYHNNAKYYAQHAGAIIEEAAAEAVEQAVEEGTARAVQAEEAAAGSASDAEAWAVGQRGGEDVPSTDPTYHNSAAYWAAQAHGIAVADTYRLMADMLPGTAQEITFDANGNVQKIEHKAGAIVEREDAFTFGTDTITEVRTLDTGDVLTIVTNTETLITTVTVTAAA